MYRAAQALARGDVSGTMRYAQRTLDLAPAEAHVARGAAAGLLGLAYWTSGQLEDAHRSYAECLSRLQKANYISDTFGCAIALADIRIAQGRLHDAMRTYEQARERGESMAVMRGMADIDVGLSEIYRERNELTTALQHLQQSKALGEHAALPQNRYRWCVAMARIREAEGELDDALRLLDEAERVYVGDFFPNVRPIAALRARVWLAHGRLGEAIHWVRERGLSIEDDLSYLREFEHITLARVLLEQAKAQDSYAMRVAVGLLDRLLLAAEQGERTHSVIEILVLLACAHHELGNADLALAALQRALVLAEPEGYIRIFVDEGQPMQQLLRRISDTGKKHKAYLQKILAAFGPPNQTDSLPVHAQPLPEPLSQREIEVLRLLNTELSGPEIASELVVALSTVRTYTKSIYGKLAVNSRRAAVRRAIELGLM